MNINNSRPTTGSLRLTESDMKRREETRKWQEENGYREPSYSSATSSVTRKTSSSGYPGVYWSESKNKFEAQYRDSDKKTVYVGKFDNAEEAYRALQQAAQEAGSSYSHREPINISGVTWHKAKNKWVAKYSHQGQRITVGYFNDKDEAKAALDADRARRGLSEIGTDKHAPRWRRTD